MINELQWYATKIVYINNHSVIAYDIKIGFIDSLIYFQHTKLTHKFETCVMCHVFNRRVDVNVTALEILGVIQLVLGQSEI